MLAVACAHPYDLTLARFRHVQACRRSVTCATCMLVRIVPNAVAALLYWRPNRVQSYTNHDSLTNWALLSISCVQTAFRHRTEWLTFAYAPCTHALHRKALTQYVGRFCSTAIRAGSKSVSHTLAASSVSWVAAWQRDDSSAIVELCFSDGCQHMDMMPGAAIPVDAFAQSWVVYTQVASL